MSEAETLSLIISISAKAGEVAEVHASHFRGGHLVVERDLFTSTPKANALRERIAQLVAELRNETREGG